MPRLALLFQVFCKYCLLSSLVQKDKIKNKILHPLSLLTPIQPPVLISFLNFTIAIWHTSFSTFPKKLALLLADLATYQCIRAHL